MRGDCAQRDADASASARLPIIARPRSSGILSFLFQSRHRICFSVPKILHFITSCRISIARWSLRFLNRRDIAGRQHHLLGRNSIKFAIKSRQDQIRNILEVSFLRTFLNNDHRSLDRRDGFPDHRAIHLETLSAPRAIWPGREGGRENTRSHHVLIHARGCIYEPRAVSHSAHV